MTFTARVTSITQDTILPKVFDNFLSDTLVTYRFIGNGSKWTGETLKRPIMVAKNNLGGSFSGLDVHSTATVETRVSMYYDPRGYEIPVAIPGIEKAVNSASETQIINLIKVEMDTAYLSGMDDISTMFYADGTGNGNKDFLGLDALDDDGTSVVTLGGLSRTTYPTLKGTRTASGGTMTLGKLATLNSACASGSSAKQRPTLMVSSETEWDLYESLLTPIVRANYQANGYPQVTRNSKGAIASAELSGGAGYTSLIYRGIPWVADEKAPTQTVWMVNENYLDWYGLKSPDLQQISLGSQIEGAAADAPTGNTGLQWSGLMTPVNQFGEVGHIYLLGNMTTFQPRRHGRLTGVTGV